MQLITNGQFRFSNFRKFTPVVAIAFIAILGSGLLLTSHAATPTSSIEPESGSTSSHANVLSDTTASNNSALKFSTTASTTAVKPTYSNTGARSSLRTDLPALTTVTTAIMSAKDANGRAYLDPGTPGNPHIVQNIDFKNANIYGGSTAYYSTHDITFINCVFEGTTTDQIVSIADSTPKNESVQFIDSTIGFASPNGNHPIGSITGVKFERVAFVNGDHAIHDILGTGYVSIDSSILDARPTSNNADSLGSPHGNALYTETGPAPNVSVTNSVLYGGNSEIVFDNAGGGNGNEVPISGWTFDSDWFYGNDNKAQYPWDAEYAFLGGGSSASEGFSVSVTNSRFQALGTGLVGLAREGGVNGLTFTQWSNNVWDDTGAQIPVPTNYNF